MLKKDKEKRKYHPHFCLGSFIYIYILYILFSEYLWNFFVCYFLLFVLLLLLFYFNDILLLPCSFSLSLWFYSKHFVTVFRTLIQKVNNYFRWTCFVQKLTFPVCFYIMTKKKYFWSEKETIMAIVWFTVCVSVLLLFIWHLQHNTRQRQFIEVFPIRCLESVSWGKKNLHR